MVADGYRFIVGLQGFENTAREYVNATDHNEYFGNVTSNMGGGCGACHDRGYRAVQHPRRLPVRYQVNQQQHEWLL